MHNALLFLDLSPPYRLIRSVNGPKSGSGPGDADEPNVYSGGTRHTAGRATTSELSRRHRIFTYSGNRITLGGQPNWSGPAAVRGTRLRTLIRRANVAQRANIILLSSSHICPNPAIAYRHTRSP